MNLREHFQTARVTGSYYPHRRPSVVRAIGLAVHPDGIAAAWYAADCPSPFDTSSLSWSLVIRWRLACLLRGTRTV